MNQQKETTLSQSSQAVPMRIRASHVGVILLAALLCAGLFSAILPVVSDSPQEYTDMIFGLASYYGNKSGELNLYKILLAVGLMGATVLSIFIKPREDRECKLPLLPYLLVALNLGMLIMTDEIMWKPVAAAVACFLCLAICRERVNQLMIAAICVYYSVTGVITLLPFLFWDSLSPLFSSLNDQFLILVFFAMFSLWLYFWKKRGDTFLKRSVWIMQALIPLNLLMFLKNNYLYGEEMVSLSYPRAYRWIIIGLILACIGTCIAQYLKHKNDSLSDCKGLISLSLVIVVLVMNSYIVPAQIVPSDTWHHGEQITEWQQIFVLDQSLYENFNPSSGNFALLPGLFQFLLFGGEATAYPAAYSCVLMLTAAVCAILMYRFTSPAMALLLCAVSCIGIYNRSYLILPYLLLLSMPRLIENRSAWFKVWILGTLLAGLYYPIYGVAMLVAVLPFGIVQLIEWFRGGELRSKLRSPWFWLGWILTLAVVALSCPLLLRMVEYTLNLASQSLYADSILMIGTVSGPEYFLTFLPEGLRYAVYIMARVFIPIIAILLPLTSAIVLSVKKRKERFVTTPLFLVLTASAILPVIAGMYTMYRADSGSILSRTFAILLPTSQYLFLGIFQFGKPHFTSRARRNVASIFLVIASVGCVTISSICQFPNIDQGVEVGGFASDAARLTPYYTIDETAYTYLDEEALTQETDLNWGSGFCATESYEQMMEMKRYIDTHHMQDTAFVNLPRYYYTVLNVKAAYSDSTSLLQTKLSQKAAIACYETYDRLPIITTIDCFGNYDILQWMREKDYVRLENGWYVCRADLETYGLSDARVDPIHYACGHYGMVPANFGNSMDSLEQRFTGQYDVLSDWIGEAERNEDTGATEITAVLPEAVSGADYGYLYIDLWSNLDLEKDYETRWEDQPADPLVPEEETESYLTWDDTLEIYYRPNPNMTRYTVTVRWGMERDGGLAYQQSAMILGNGKLLIPVNRNLEWTENQIKTITISCSDLLPEGTEFSVREMRLLTEASE